MKTGYNEVGELNNIIILYPQAVSIIGNPNGCWDWWGYNNAFYGESPIINIVLKSLIFYQLYIQSKL